jgi:GNAT superfamily N-acetyltransferase
MGIAVLSDYKKNGIGKMLLSKVEKWAQDTGAYGIRLVSGATKYNLGWGIMDTLYVSDLDGTSIKGAN